VPDASSATLRNDSWALPHIKQAGTLNVGKNHDDYPQISLETLSDAIDEVIQLINTTLHAKEFHKPNFFTMKICASRTLSTTQ
jgi:hypothetical protein